MEKPSKDSSFLSKKQKRKLHKIVRRIHLYLGLTLIPWLLLYGGTALLFNHGMWMTEREDFPLDASAPLLKSADSVVKDMAQTFEEIGFQVVPESAQWIGSLSLKGKSENANARIIINAEGQGGLVVLRPTEDPQPEWTETLDDWLMVDEEQEKEIEKEVQMMIEQDHPEISSISMHRYPKLRFQVQKDSEIFTVDVRHKSGLSVFETEGSQNLRTKMLRLHTMHGDPGYTGAKWIWVKIIDIVGVAMIVWGFSGLIMWWTIRPTRRQGAVAIAVGTGLMVVLSTTLWSIYGY